MRSKISEFVVYFFDGEMCDFDEDRVFVEVVKLLQDPEQPFGQERTLTNADPTDHCL